MSFIDIVILVIFAGAIIYGFWKGIISQIGSVAAIILGIIACRIFGDAATDLTATLLPELAKNPETSRYACSVIGNVILFLLVYLTVKLLASFIKKVADALLVGFIDKILGAAFCIFKWFLVTSLVLNIWCLIFPDSSIIKHSSLAGGKAINAIIELAPAILGSLTAPLS